MASPQRLLSLVVLLALHCSMPAWAQSRESSGAAAISEAVREGSNPYRPPSAPNPNANATPEEARRARCDQLLQDINETSKQRTYTSSGTATQNAQGRAVPKIERDKTRKKLQQSYRDNCS